jgi:hypothetical protein
MKKIFKFEVKDFEGCGQMVIRNSFPENSKDYSFGATVSYKIGWMSSARSVGNIIMLVSLADGMCLRFDSEQALCDHLNNDSEGYRPMSKVEIARIMETQGNRF